LKKTLEKIIHNNHLLAIIIRHDYHAEGIQFFTDNNSSQQLGYMNRPAGYVIPPHRHNLHKRDVHLTQEVLFIKSGKIRVDFYDNEQNYIKSTILYSGDVILLADGGHGFKMLEPSEIIEVKQGPYSEEKDKVRFSPVSEDKILLT
jgi:mannose-6-phosphate isomerase-like protein (cupin superfamily)